MVSLVMKSLLGLGCLFAAHPAMAGMIDKEGMAEWEICALCHSLDGISRMSKFPKLAGQKSAYISKQLKDFHFGRRLNDGGQMGAITTEVDMDTVPAIANYFAQLPPPPAAELDSDAETMELFRLGQEIFFKGVENTQSCASCHDHSAKQSVASARLAPWLFAQHEDYLIKQLNDFKAGNRVNDLTDSMQHLAKNLRPESIRAVAFYLAHKQPGKGPE